MGNPGGNGNSGNNGNGAQPGSGPAGNNNNIPRYIAVQHRRSAIDKESLQRVIDWIEFKRKMR